jgi:hypothetical protein
MAPCRGNVMGDSLGRRLMTSRFSLEFYWRCLIIVVSHLVNRSSPNEGRGELASIALISGNVNGTGLILNEVSAD